ncbi:MAG: hypothetical protein OXT74_18445 [Candidatus Poribacteria bacterium]|nr:hypothetical protein [Candidatus Poribacteria bacterium]
MYITFDGIPGIGKSTQKKILTKRHDFEPDSLFHSVYHAMKNMAIAVSGGTFHSDLMSWIMASQGLNSTRDYIIEHFWTHLDGGLDLPESEFYDVINFLRKGLALGECGEPALSIALQSSPDIIANRVIGRDYGDIKELGDMKLNDRIKKSVHRMDRFWRELEKRLPYFHIIDATKPIDEIAGIIQHHLENVKRTSKHAREDRKCEPHIVPAATSPHKIKKLPNRV